MLKISKYHIEIFESNFGWIRPYYIVFSDGDYDFIDQGVAYLLGIPYSKYLLTLVKKFNAYHNKNGRIIFYNRKDAKRALEWLESVYVAEKLLT